MIVLFVKEEAGDSGGYRQEVSRVDFHAEEME